MARYLLDTNSIISFSKEVEPMLSLIQSLIISGDELGVTPINVAEFYAGLYPTQIPQWNRFFADMLYWPINKTAAIQAGKWRYDFARKGKILTTADTLVAAVAKEQEATIITGNMKDYPMGVLLYPTKN